LHKYVSTILAIIVVLSTQSATWAQNNLVFVTSTTFAANLGSAGAYDAQCNARATAAGLSNPGNNQFVAWMSDSTSRAYDRLGLAARGYIRVDGAPVADRILEDLLSFNGNEILNPIDRNEFGAQVSAAATVWTGTTEIGTASSATCINWTSNSVVSPGAYGVVSGGPVFWTVESGAPCSVGRRIYCLQKTYTNPLFITPTQHPIAFITSNTFRPSDAEGLMGADSLCANEAAQAGLAGSWKALLATSTAAAASRFAGYSGNYRRPDGIVIGSSAAIMSGSALQSGIWQTASGLYQPTATGVGSNEHLVFAGSVTPDVAGTAATTCNDWTSSGGTASAGKMNYASTKWWDGSFAQACGTSARTYCLQVVEGARRRSQVVSE
jgi:hypothetical protein